MPDPLGLHIARLFFLFPVVFNRCDFVRPFRRGIGKGDSLTCLSTHRRLFLPFNIHPGLESEHGFS